MKTDPIQIVLNVMAFTLMLAIVALRLTTGHC